MKLELKHIAPYFLYDLLCLCTQLDFPKSLYLKTCNTEILEPLIGIKNGKFLIGGNRIDVDNWDFKPIFIPMFDLVADKETCDLLNLKLEPNGLFLNGWYLLQNSLNSVAISYEEMQNILNILYAKHYDVFGLIPLGLAVSIHDVGQVIA